MPDFDSPSPDGHAEVAAQFDRRIADGFFHGIPNFPIAAASVGAFQKQSQERLTQPIGQFHETLAQSIEELRLDMKILFSGVLLSHVSAVIREEIKNVERAFARLAGSFQSYAEANDARAKSVDKALESLASSKQQILHNDGMAHGYVKVLEPSEAIVGGDATPQKKSVRSNFGIDVVSCQATARTQDDWVEDASDEDDSDEAEHDANGPPKHCPAQYGWKRPSVGARGQASLSSTIHSTGRRPHVSSFGAELPPYEKHKSQFHFHRHMLRRYVTKKDQRKDTVKRTVGRCHKLLLRLEAPRSFRDFVYGRFFNFVCAIMTVCFACVLGLESDMQIRSEFGMERELPLLQPISLIVNIVFVLEVLCRFGADGLWYFLGPDGFWNMFDSVLACICVVEVFLDGLNFVLTLRLLRSLKVVRALRVVRVLRIFAELRLLVASMLNSLLSLVWSLVFLVLVTYLVSIALVNGAVLHLQGSGKHSSSSEKEAVGYFFGSVLKTMYSLVAAITGGYEWTSVALPLWRMNKFYASIFIVFVLVSIMGIMNVITGIFVDNAVNITKFDRDFAIAQHAKNVKADVKETMKLFSELDTEKRGFVTMEEFRAFFADARVIAYFSTLEIDVSEPDRVVCLFDHSGDGVITVEDFVVGCISLQGSAKKSDIQAADHSQASHLSHIEKRMMMMERMIRRLVQCAEVPVASFRAAPALAGAMFPAPTMEPVRQNPSSSPALDARAMWL